MEETTEGRNASNEPTQAVSAIGEEQAFNGTRMDDGGDTTVQHEGHSARLLSQVIDRTIDKTMSTSRISLWAQAYPTIYHKRKEAITYISEKFRDLLTENMKVEIETMFEEENIIGLLNSLDTLNEESDHDPDKIAWRPSGVPDDDARSHIAVVKRRQRGHLQAMLKQAEGERARREASVAQRQRILQGMQEKLKEQVDAFQNAYSEVHEGGRIARQFLVNNNC